MDNLQAMVNIQGFPGVFFALFRVTAEAVSSIKPNRLPPEEADVNQGG